MQTNESSNTEAPNTAGIRVLENGPYEVTGNVPLNQLRFVTNSKGASTRYEEVMQFPLKKSYRLCRCGNSENKPFCDGAHRNEFDGEETANHLPYDDEALFIEGQRIDLLDAKGLCAVARFCDTNGGTWRLAMETASEKTTNMVIQQCCDCPSGRLTAVTKEGKRIEPELPQEISLLEDTLARVHGPIWVKGGIPVEDAKGDVYPVRNRVTLCRCGLSANKPFCDGRHLGSD